MYADNRNLSPIRRKPVTNFHPTPMPPTCHEKYPISAQVVHSIEESDELPIWLPSKSEQSKKSMVSGPNVSPNPGPGPDPEPQPVSHNEQQQPISGSPSPSPRTKKLRRRYWRNFVEEWEKGAAESLLKGDYDIPSDNR
eukprot:TRINITY_DN4128_c5_g1_i1.p1 TRINITY_DN4128_c5_g1~~TRINITY_DN4128_c5_g1_i1.p1  ORF type:complete len:139 (+),score=13.39 TRINITY_DN4128_c5_g1_i1:32-448(+)